MRAAPAVSVLCSLGGAWRWVLTLLPALATAALLTWAAAYLQLPSASAWLAVASITSLVALVALLAWRRARPQALLLAWDGQRWTADGCAGDLDLMMDLGPWMLLRLRPDDKTRRAVWIPVSATDAGAARHALRAALYSRTSKPASDALPAAPGSAAKAD